MCFMHRHYLVKLYFSNQGIAKAQGEVMISRKYIDFYVLHLSWNLHYKFHHSTQKLLFLQ